MRFLWSRMLLSLWLCMVLVAQCLSQVQHTSTRVCVGTNSYTCVAQQLKSMTPGTYTETRTPTASSSPKPLIHCINALENYSSQCFCVYFFYSPQAALTPLLLFLRPCRVQRLSWQRTDRPLCHPTVSPLACQLCSWCMTWQEEAHAKQ